MTAWMSKKKSICYLIEKRLWEEQLQVTLIRWGGGRGGPVGEQQAHLRDAGGQMSWRPVLLAFLGDPAETTRSEGGLGCQSIPGRKRRLQPHQRFQKKSALGPGVPVLHAARPCPAGAVCGCPWPRGTWAWRQNQPSAFLIKCFRNTDPCCMTTRHAH